MGRIDGASLVSKLGRAGGLLATAGALALLCCLQAIALYRAPTTWSPTSIGIHLAPGSSLTLGRTELAAPQADEGHLALRRDADGAWWVRNQSTGKRLLIQRGADEQQAGTVIPKAGMQFRLGTQLFTVEDADAKRMRFTDGMRHWHYDGANLRRDDAPSLACPDTHLVQRLLATWNRWVPHALTMARAVKFGGNLYCDNRLGIAGVAAGSAYLYRQDGQLLLTGGTPDGEPSMLSVTEQGGDDDLARMELPLADATGLVVGHTQFALRTQADGIALLPLRHVALFNSTDIRLPAAVSWQWQKRDIWSLPALRGLWLPGVLVVALALWALLTWQRGQWPCARGSGWSMRAAVFGAALLAIAGLAALALQRGGSAPGVAWSVLLGGAALWFYLLAPGRLTLVSAVGIVLLAVGLLSQLEQGVGSLDSSWLRYFQKTVCLLALGVGGGTLLRLRLREQAATLPQTTVEWMLAGLAACALAILAAQVLWGDETGVFDIQPVEFAKLALTALTAHCLAVGLGWRHQGGARGFGIGKRWLHLGAPALLFLALLGMALIQVDDYSPLVLLMVWTTVMGFCYALATRKWLLGGGIGAIAACAGCAIVYLRMASTSDVISWGFYADRFLVWLDPASHPYTGQQLLLGARAIAEGAWFGADHLLGLTTLGQSAGAALRIPAVQDDFAPSFFLNRHGLASALGLWTLQALLLVGVLHTAARAWSSGHAARDFRHAWRARFRCFGLCGGAAFLLGQFLLSWGTNLAIFPIMGQPMSFLSAGGSHLLFFLCPLLTFCAISAQSFEETESCRSMSNTKSSAK